MKIYVNGKQVKTIKDTNLKDLLKNIFLGKPGAYAIAINNQFIPKSIYEDIVIKEGDQIEILTPHPGG